MLREKLDGCCGSVHLDIRTNAQQENPKNSFNELCCVFVQISPLVMFSPRRHLLASTTIGHLDAMPRLNTIWKTSDKSHMRSQGVPIHCFDGQRHPMQKGFCNQMAFLRCRCDLGNKWREREENPTKIDNDMQWHV